MTTVSFKALNTTICTMSVISVTYPLETCITVVVTINTISTCSTFWMCCAIMCLYFLSSVLWPPLRFPHRKDVRFVFASYCLQEASCLSYLCMIAHNGVEYICYCAFVVLCTLCCQFPWIAHFLLPLGYSLMFIYCWFFTFRPLITNFWVLKLFLQSPRNYM